MVVVEKTRFVANDFTRSKDESFTMAKPVGPQIGAEAPVVKCFLSSTVFRVRTFPLVWIDGHGIVGLNFAAGSQNFGTRPSHGQRCQKTSSRDQDAPL